MARKNKGIAVRYTVALVGDGQTERIYFAGVRDTDRPAGLQIFPDQPKRFGNFKGVLDRAVALSEDYDRVYSLIDMDKVFSDGQEAAYAAAKVAALEAGVIVLENNPCFEMWILLHFENTAVLFNNCDAVSVRLRRHLQGYDKSEKYLAAAKLYQRHRQAIIGNAIPRARLLEAGRADKSKLHPRAEVFRFFEWYFGR